MIPTETSVREHLRRNSGQHNGFSLTFLGWIQNPRSTPNYGKKIGIGDVLRLWDSRGAHNFAQPNAGTGSEVVSDLPDEFQEGDMVDALSRVVEQKSLGNWKELDNKSEDRKVERDAEREGEPNILATFGSDRGITIWDPKINFLDITLRTRWFLNEWGVIRPWLG
ncbi:hypothetical protein Tco_0819067 [Tanacetum coccineum]|uniref:Uncharacterized protein n=1 Tax=Tanacetum coccineum TaxID=301880 RepID=A0ABQ5A9F2_9ASTR